MNILLGIGWGMLAIIICSVIAIGLGSFIREAGRDDEQ